MKQSDKLTNTNLLIGNSSSNFNRLENVVVNDIEFNSTKKAYLPTKPNNRLLNANLNHQNNQNNYPPTLPGLGNYHPPNSHIGKKVQRTKLLAIRKREKNQQFLNSLIEILRTDDPSTDKETKKSPSGNKTLKTEPPLLNEFMELKPSSVKSYHKPKVIENEVLRIGNHQNLIRRKLRSEEKSRNMRPEIQRKARQSFSGFNVTFYQSTEEEGQKVTKTKDLKPIKIHF